MKKPNSTILFHRHPAAGESGDPREEVLTATNTGRHDISWPSTSKLHKPLQKP